MRIIRRLPMDTPTVLLYDRKALHASLLVDYETLVLVFKMKHGLVKCNRVITYVSNVHSYGLRRRNDFYVPATRTSTAQKNIFSRGFVMYNALPNCIKNIRTLTDFKNRIRVYLINDGRL